MEFRTFFLPTSYFFSFLLLHIRPDLLYQKKLVFYQLAENRHPAILRFVCIEMGYLFLKICYKQQNYISKEQNMNAIDKNEKFKLTGIWNPLKVTHKSSRINYYPFVIVYRQRNSPFFHVEYQPLAPRSTPCSSSPFFWRGIKKNASLWDLPAAANQPAARPCYCRHDFYVCKQAVSLSLPNLYPGGRLNFKRSYFSKKGGGETRGQGERVLPSCANLPLLLASFPSMWGSFFCWHPNVSATAALSLDIYWKMRKHRRSGKKQSPNFCLR